MRIAVPSTGKRKLSNRISESFSKTPEFTIVTVEKNQIKNAEIVENPGNTPERGAGPLAARALKDNNVDVLLTVEIGPGASTILEAMGIKIVLVEQRKTVKELVEDYLGSL